MSEFNPFGTAAGEATEVPDAVEATSDSRRTLAVAGAVAAAALGAGAFFLLTGGGEVGDDLTTAVRAPRAAPAATAAPAPVKLPVSTKVALGRNPFRALYVAPVADTSGGGRTVAQTFTEPVSQPVSQPVQPGAPPAAAPVAPAGRPAAAPDSAVQSTVALQVVAAGKDGANPTATFVYDGKTVTGAPGDVMAGKLLVISLQQDATGGWFANLQLGDGSPFEVHERQTVVVQ